MTENEIQVRQAFGRYGPQQAFYAVQTLEAYNASHGMVGCEIESILYRTPAEVHAAIADGTIEWND